MIDMKNKDKQMCFNCKYRTYNSESGVTECLISKEQRDSYLNQWSERYGDADGCPFKKLDDGGEFTYWQ